MKTKKPRIALLFAGGTIGMVENPKTGVLQPAQDSMQILESVPELKKTSEISFFPLFNIDSSNITPVHWQGVAEKIDEIYDRFDGFVLIQGTDTLAYSASALSFAIQNLGKPIICTGSLIPLCEIGGDARNNLLYSCIVAGMDIAEVCILVGNRILRGNRSKKNHESFVDVFHSPAFPPLGEIERPIKLFEWRKKRADRNPVFHPHFESNIRLVKLFPGLPPHTMDRMIEGGARGLIIEGFGPGNIPFLGSSLLPGIERAMRAGIPVVIASQMEKSSTNLTAYEAGYKAKQIGVIEARDMTIEATVTKLMWVLAKTRDPKRIQKQMESPLAGELSV